jgi:hypothetical protein
MVRRKHSTCPILHIRIFLYFCSLFNDAVIHFGYVTSNDQMIVMNYVKVALMA